MKHSRSHTRSVSYDISSKPEELDKFNLNYVLPESAETMSLSTPGRRTPKSDRNDASSMSTQDARGKSRKSGRISLMECVF